MVDLVTPEQRRIVQRARFGTFLVNEYAKASAQDLSRSIPRILNEYQFPNLTKAEVTRVIADMRRNFTTNWDNMWGQVTSDLGDMALDESRFLINLYSGFTAEKLSRVTKRALLSAINNSVMTLVSGDNTNAGVWRQFISRNVDSTFGLINGAVRVGFQEGQTNQQIVQLLRGTYNRSTRDFRGGILNGRAVARADALVRTGVAHYSAIARDRTIQANDDLFDARILYATFDSRTSLICQGRHLREWDINDNTYPRLPFHFNERSIYLFRIDGETPFTGTRSSRGAEGGQQVPANQSIETFLRNQPRSFVEQTLGKTRADLFLDGRLPIRNFTDLQGRTLTLDELRETTRGATAFRRIDG